MKTVHKHAAERRGATLTGYGLIVGLIAIVALVATTGIGSSVKGLFDETGGTLQSVVEGTGSATVPAPSAGPNATPTFGGSLPTPAQMSQNASIAPFDVSTFTDADADSLTFTLGDGGSGIAADFAVVENDIVGNASDTSDGTAARISGTPTQQGNFQLTVTATDPSGAEVTTGSINISVGAPQVVSAALCAMSGQTLSGFANGRTFAFDHNGNMWSYNQSGAVYEAYSFNSGAGSWTRNSPDDLAVSTTGTPLGTHIRNGKLYLVTNSSAQFKRYNLTSKAQEAQTNLSGVTNAQGVTSNGSGNIYVGTYDPTADIFTVDDNGSAISDCSLATDRNRGATYDPSTGYYYFATQDTIRVVSDPVNCTLVTSYSRSFGTSQDIAYFSGFVFEQNNTGSMMAVPAYQNTVCP